MTIEQEKELILAKWISLDKIAKEIVRNANKILSLSKTTKDDDKRRFLQSIELSAKNTLIEMYISTYEQAMINTMMKENPEQFLNASAENTKIVNSEESKVKNLGVIPTANNDKKNTIKQG